MLCLWISCCGGVFFSSWLLLVNFVWFVCWCLIRWWKWCFLVLRLILMIVFIRIMWIILLIFVFGDWNWRKSLLGVCILFIWIFFVVSLVFIRLSFIMIGFVVWIFIMVFVVLCIRLMIILFSCWYSVLVGRVFMRFRILFGLMSWCFMCVGLLIWFVIGINWNGVSVVGEWLCIGFLWCLLMVVVWNFFVIVFRFWLLMRKVCFIGMGVWFLNG